MNEAVLYINTNKHPEARVLLEEFDRKCSGLPLTQDIIFVRLNAGAELTIRTGWDVKETLNLIESNLKTFDSIPEKKVWLLLRAGQLERMTNHMKISPRYFSKALGEAEDLEDDLLIAECYHKIGVMFANRYPGLAVYFFRKAELKFLFVGHKKDAYICRMERAKLYFITLKTGNVNPRYATLLADEALRIATEHVDVDMTPYEAVHCQEIKAIVTANEEILMGLINNIKNIEALPKKCRYEEEYIGICLEKGLWKEAEQMFDMYKQDCIAFHTDIPDVEEKLGELQQLIKDKQPCNFIPFHLKRQPNEEITLFDLLDHYSMEDEGFALDRSIFRSLLPSYEQEGLFEAIKMHDGKVRLFPLGLAFNVYYRGQSKYYDPSYPSLYRKGVTESQRFVERMKYEELKRCIESYPATDYFKKDFAFVMPDGTYNPIEFSVDVLALAQHYGVLTELMDLTTDKFVAAFFATTNCDGNDVYSPITELKKEKGVFYRFSNTYFITGRLPEKLRAVGLQPFSRPGEQMGLVYQMDKDENFNDVVISKDEFTHNPTVAEFIFNYTNRSKKLFPESPLTRHAQDIAKTKKFSRWAYEEAKKEFYPNASDELLQSYLSEQKIELADDVDFSFSEEEINECRKDWEEGGREKAMSKTVFRSVTEPATTSPSQQP